MDHFILITRHNFTSAGCVQIKVMRKHFFSECVSVTEGHQCLKKTTKKRIHLLRAIPPKQRIYKLQLQISY